MSSFRHLQTAPLGAFLDKNASRLSSFLNYLRLIRRAVTANKILALSSSLNYVHLIRPLNRQNSDACDRYLSVPKTFAKLFLYSAYILA